ncbi:MAG: DUF1275 family protein, partial [Betaproteobacteria bacterium]
RLFSFSLPARGLPVLRTMLSLKLALLAIGAALAIHYGPFTPANEGAMFVTGMVLVAAMAIQNAVSRIHLGTAPPTTLMTGTTTQMMIDLADLMRGAAPDAKAAAKARLARMGSHVVAFALGCAAGAIAFAQVGTWCFAVPPLVALVPILMPASRIEA